MPKLRRTTGDDDAFIRRMLEETMNWDPSRPRETVVEIARRYPEITRYADGWGRPGDEGFIAEEEGEPIGAAWFRVFSADRPGFGFIDEETPELAIALVPEARGRGVGTELLEELFQLARERGHARISLSVEIVNPARALYERFGFVKVEDDDDGYRKMVLDLNP